MQEIRKVAVLGSGVMGAGIAAHAANAGADVVLLDIVPPGAENRNALAEGAIQRTLKNQPSGFTQPGNAARITPGNLEDHLHLLADADWIIEAVLEKLDVKQDVYRRIDSVRRPGCIVSSNTSTLPLRTLIQGMPEPFAQDFMIAHFFNPPRFMRLLEVTAGLLTRREGYEAVKRFADEKLGKQVVECKDTPGFIANRIGIFWMVTGLLEAQRLNIGVEAADAVMGKPSGIPRTGMFGLYDLIGIDLIPLIAKAMLDTLPPEDAFRRLYREPDLLKKMIADGYTGRKGKGGFYRVTKQGDRKVTEVLDLSTGEYRHPLGEVQLESLNSARGGLKALLTHDDIGAQYARAVWMKTLGYAASLIPGISDGIAPVDEAMRTGYSWKWGPFELIDQIGAADFVNMLTQEGIPVPPLLAAAGGRSLYTQTDTPRRAMTLSGEYAAVRTNPGHLWLSDVRRGKEPVIVNASAALWDMGDGIACLEFKSKMNAVDMNILAMLEQAVSRVRQNFQGLVIGNDSDQFCVGANLSVFLQHAQAEEWSAISDMIRRGQQAMMGLKYAPFPVVASLSGLALGGGCEIVLHMRAVQAHIECSPGLVEANVGLIPAWGGCKEMLLRHGDAVRAFEPVVTAQTAASAQGARDLCMLRESDGISMNRARLLADAKTRALALVGTPTPTLVSLRGGGAAAKQAILDRLEALGAEGRASPHDLVIGRVLAHVLSAGEVQGPVSEQDILALEHDGFMELIRTTASQERIAHMLKTGKPLKN